MAREKSDTRSARAWALAGRQHGVVTRAQLMRLGFSEEAIEHRLAKGRLHPIGRGVYAVGWPHLDRKRRWMAAVLACGEGAALSHRSAAVLWEVRSERRGAIEISVRRRCEIRREGIRARSRPSLPADEIVLRDRIPVTAPARTLLDLATVVGSRSLERAVNEADKRDLIDPEVLREALANFSGEPGVRVLRRLLDRHTFCLTDSELEVLFRPIAADAGLTSPRTKAWINGFEVDFFWPDLGLVVETDGLRYHRTASSQARDHFRDQTHTAAGLTALRFSHWQVKHERGHVRAVLVRTAEHLRGGVVDLSCAGGREKRTAFEAS